VGLTCLRGRSGERGLVADPSVLLQGADGVQSKFVRNGRRIASIVMHRAG
jgi:hypothetical protein